MKFLILFFLVGCATIQQVPQSTSKYRKDLAFQVDGVNYTGFAVVQDRPVYTITFKRGSGDYASISNCHRHIPIQDPPREISYQFKKQALTEDIGSCFIQLSNLDEKGKHHWGVIDFSNGEKLPATISCNGEKFDNIGASFCQSKDGLVQSLRFKDNVTVKFPEMCNPAEKISDKEYVVYLSKGYCIYRFESSDGRSHRLTTFGYDDEIKE